MRRRRLARRRFAPLGLRGDNRGSVDSLRKRLSDALPGFGSQSIANFARDGAVYEAATSPGSGTLVLSAPAACIPRVLQLACPARELPSGRAPSMTV